MEDRIGRCVRASGNEDYFIAFSSSLSRSRKPVLRRCLLFILQFVDQTGFLFCKFPFNVLRNESKKNIDKIKLKKKNIY